MKTTTRLPGRLAAMLAAVAFLAVPALAQVKVIVGGGSGNPDGTVRHSVERGKCTYNGDCDDGVYCNGQELCDVRNSRADDRGCVASPPPCPTGAICDEANNICRDACLDADGDGYQSAHCGGTDCDDNDARRHPGATEFCDVDGIDEDCDPTTIAGPEGDADGDGFISARCWNRR